MCNFKSLGNGVYVLHLKVAQVELQPVLYMVVKIHCQVRN